MKDKSASAADFLATLPAPARRALLNAGIDSIEKLSTRTEQEVLSLHGMGKSSIPKLKLALQAAGLDFKA